MSLQVQSWWPTFRPHHKEPSSGLNSVDHDILPLLLRFFIVTTITMLTTNSSFHYALTYKVICQLTRLLKTWTIIITLVQFSIYKHNLIQISSVTSALQRDFIRINYSWCFRELFVQRSASYSPLSYLLPLRLLTVHQCKLHLFTLYINTSIFISVFSVNIVRKPNTNEIKSRSDSKSTNIKFAKGQSLLKCKTILSTFLTVFICV